MTVEHLQGNYKGQKHVFHHQFSRVLCNPSEISKEKDCSDVLSSVAFFPLTVTKSEREITLAQNEF